MNPEAIRNLNWHQMQDLLDGQLRQVLDAWRRHGPATTARCAELSGIPLLNLRPRTSDLVDLFLVQCIGRAGKEGGIYQVTNDHDAEHLWDTFRLPKQLDLL
jgi:hypothetical protein